MTTQTGCPFVPWKSTGGWACHVQCSLFRGFRQLEISPLRAKPVYRPFPLRRLCGISQQGALWRFLKLVELIGCVSNGETRKHGCPFKLPQTESLRKPQGSAKNITGSDLRECICNSRRSTAVPDVRLIFVWQLRCIRSEFVSTWK